MSLVFTDIFGILFVLTIGVRDENVLTVCDWFSTHLTVLLKVFFSSHIKVFDWLSSVLYQKAGVRVIYSYLS